MNKLKIFIKSRLPFLVYPLRWLSYSLRYGFGGSADKIFVRKYDKKGGLGGRESRSGPGSDLAETEVVRQILPVLIKELNIQSLLDIPCGDFYWMKLVEMDIDYIGGEIVPSLVEEDKKLYGNDKRQFVCLDIIKDKLPKTDMVLCRDCLFYLSNADVLDSFRNIKKSGAEYLLMTHFPEKTVNENIPTGSWRPINFELPPFNLPKPIRIFDEKCPVAGFHDKSLGLWKVSEIPDF
ncbi:MAG: class I SAM-dependent methyltransferase [bacterium]|nr:class I SAM-dependent methyltransferase [bacterium]